MNLHRKQFTSLALAAIATGFWGSALAQGAYPTKTVTMVVPTAAGGTTDLSARMLAQALAPVLGQSVIVDNKGGGNGNIAASIVKRAEPDGYTVFMQYSGYHVISPHITKQKQWDQADFQPVANVISAPQIIVVRNDLPVKTLPELMAYAKANNTNMGSYAPGSYPQMVADQANRTEGTKILTVNYRGESPMWIDVASGQLQVAIGSYQAFNTVATRGVKAIGVTGSYRCPKLPDVPTLVEQGVQGRLVQLEGGLPLMAPAGTPEAVLKLLSQVVVEGAETARAAQIRETFAIPNKPKDLAATRADWERDVPVWIKLAVDLGIKLD